jgi:hypothetical protein
MLTLTARPPTRLVAGFRSTAVSDAVACPTGRSRVTTRSRTDVLQKLVGADSTRFPHVPRRRSGH